MAQSNPDVHKTSHLFKDKSKYWHFGFFLSILYCVMKQTWRRPQLICIISASVERKLRATAEDLCCQRTSQFWKTTWFFCRHFSIQYSLIKQIRFAAIMLMESADHSVCCIRDNEKCFLFSLCKMNPKSVLLSRWLLCSCHCLHVSIKLSTVAAGWNTRAQTDFLSFNLFLSETSLSKRFHFFFFFDWISYQDFFTDLPWANVFLKGQEQAVNWQDITKWLLLFLHYSDKMVLSGTKHSIFQKQRWGRYEWLLTTSLPDLMELLIEFQILCITLRWAF